ncbi:MAG: methyltransferase domain-containing protein [Saprospiraceae bacterium]
MTSDQNLDEQYWDLRHQAGNTPWQLGVVSPPVAAYVDQLTNKDISILIPGAGHVHEAEYLLHHGFKDITICDISKVAIESIKQKLGESSGVHYVHSDFFLIGGTFDLIIEQTFFCALDPTLRSDYVSTMYRLLRNGGKLVGLLFSSVFSHSGPPFGGDVYEYKLLFGKWLHIQTMEMCYNSIPPRQNNELFFICQKLSNV